MSGYEPGPLAQAGMERAFGPETQRQRRALKPAWGNALGYRPQIS
jgi:hypothetical protein